jgi:hypothetical protein
MKRLWLLAGALFVCLTFVPGCLTEEDRQGWREALKDLRGDNQQMGSHDQKTP